MTLIFQYGSNMSAARLNDEDRLAGDANVIGIARTIELFELEFTVWSKLNGCAAANIVRCVTGTRIYGVIYEIPDFLMSRDTARARNRKSMDAIEGEGKNYVRQMHQFERMDESRFMAMTYVVKYPKDGLATGLHYVQHILDGLKEHHIPVEYQRYVVSKVIENNPALQEQFSGK